MLRCVQHPTAAAGDFWRAYVIEICRGRQTSNCVYDIVRKATRSYFSLRCFEVTLDRALTSCEMC